MKPSEKEINDALEKAYQDCKTNAFFGNGFKLAIEWLLNWQKTQPLQLWCVMAGENEILDICRSEQAAKDSIAALKKDHSSVDFWIDEIFI
jgi:hypothetical protein